MLEPRNLTDEPRLFFSIVSFDGSGYYSHVGQRDSFPGEGVIAAVDLSSFADITLDSAIDLLCQGEVELEAPQGRNSTLTDCVSAFWISKGVSSRTLLNRRRNFSLFVQLDDTIATIESYELTIDQVSCLIHRCDLHFHIGFYRQAGEIPFSDRSIFKDNGLRYSLRYRESSKHHEPHVHVRLPGKWDASLSIINGRVLDISPKQKTDPPKLKYAQLRIEHSKDRLLSCWEMVQEGLNPDLDLMFGKKNSYSNGLSS